MRTATWILLPSLVLTLLAGISHAAGDTTPLPASVTADLKSVADMCREVGGSPNTDEAVKSSDLNADGQADFVLFVGSVMCDGAASVYGDRMKEVHVYAGDGRGGAREAFVDLVYGMLIEGTGSTARVWLTVSGKQCGKPPAPNFASESFCQRALAWNAASGRFDYAPVSTVRMIE